MTRLVVLVRLPLAGGVVPLNTRMRVEAPGLGILLRKYVARGYRGGGSGVTERDGLGHTWGRVLDDMTWGRKWHGDKNGHKHMNMAKYRYSFFPYRFLPTSRRSTNINLTLWKHKFLIYRPGALKSARLS
jgi:hypothetical protein